MNTMIQSLREFNLRLTIVIAIIIPFTIFSFSDINGRALGITEIVSTIGLAFFYITFAAHAIEDDKKTSGTIYLFIAAHVISLIRTLNSLDEYPDFSNMNVMDLLTDDNSIEALINQTVASTATYTTLMNIFMLAGLFYSQKSVNKRFNVSWWFAISAHLCSIVAALSVIANNISIYTIFKNITGVLAIILIVILFIIGKPQSKNAIKTPQQAPNNSQQSCSDISGKSEELMKLKSLLDAGVLTQEEFDSEKKKILNS